MLNGGAELDHDAASIGNEIEEEAVQVGTVDIVVRCVVVVLHAAPRGVADHFACFVWAG